MPIKSTDVQTIQDMIVQNVEVKSTLHTDEAAVYTGMGGLFFDHASVNHSAGEFSRDGVPLSLSYRAQARRVRDHRFPALRFMLPALLWWRNLSGQCP